MAPRSNSEKKNEASSFDLDEPSSFEHTTRGVWEIYTQRKSRSWSKLLTTPLGMSELWSAYRRDVPYVMRVFHDLWAAASGYVSLYFLSKIPVIFLPSVSLWYSGQLIQLVQTAIDTRTLDSDEMIKILTIKVLCNVFEQISIAATEHFLGNIKRRMTRAYTARLFKAVSRLDVPTSLDPVVQSHLNQLTQMTWYEPVSVSKTTANALQKSTTLLGQVLSMASQILVLFTLLRNKQDGPALAAVTAVRYVSGFLTDSAMMGGLDEVWVAGTENELYVRMMGLLSTVCDGKHRQEIYANNIASYMHKSFQQLQARLGYVNSLSFWELPDKTGDWWFYKLQTFLESTAKEMPMIFLATRAMSSPRSIPTSMASLSVVEQATTAFFRTLSNLRFQLHGFSNDLKKLRTLYDLEVVPNLIVDGTLPFPEDSATLRDGVSLEFRNVSFRYPGKEEYAVRNVSFRVEAGQLCIIVGTNGSGKSTILKLITRVYDATEGKILVNGQDIKTLKLHDLHRATAVLFQDYTHMKLSLRDNIAIGDPENADDDERVMEAARLGGVDTIVEKLPKKYDTYLHRPVQDILSNIPPGMKKVFGRDASKHQGRRMAMSETDVTDTWLSGGQMQKLAVARTFMRSLPDDQRVGLLLFDEPSAHLDPKAEYDLFARLRALRGAKTMLFSTHRFGNLTLRADVILYMDDSVVVEAGTHEQLLEKGGQYQELWKMQAQAFV